MNSENDDLTPSCGKSRVKFSLVGAASLAMLVTTGCAASEKTVARGRFAGQDVCVHVTGEIERFYIEDYVHNKCRAGPIARAIDDAIFRTQADPYDADSLRALASEVSIDVATLYFVAALYDDPENRRMQDKFEALVRDLSSSGAAAWASPHRSSYVIAFVPGYGYRKDRTTGSDFAQQRALLSECGFNVRLIETNEVGTIESNADFIAASLQGLASEAKKIVVVSTSKAGPEVALALGDPANHGGLSHVRAWISVGGVLRGSPYADHLMHHPLHAWIATFGAVLGHPRGIIENLSTGVRTPVMDRLIMPPELLIVHYVGAPLESQVERENRGRFKTLKHLGPNDGLTLLADEISRGNVVITDIGLDHYFRHPQIDLITLALAHVVLEELESGGAP